MAGPGKYEMVCSNGQPQHTILAQNMLIGPGQAAVTFTSLKHHRCKAPVTRVLQAANKEVCLVRLLKEYAAIRLGT